VLVTFSIDPAALHDRDAGAFPGVHTRLIRLWEKYGVLIVPGEKLTASQLSQAIEKLPLTPRKLWKEAIRQNLRRKCLPSWSGVSQTSALDDLRRVDGALDVLLVGQELGSVLGIHVRGSVATFGSVEVGELLEVDNVPKFLASVDLCCADIGRGESVQQIWDSRFKRLADFTSSAAVVDRYAANDFWTNRGDSGLHWLITQLSRSSVTELAIFFARQERLREGDVIASLRECADSVVPSNLRRILAYVNDDAVMRAYAHERWLRFGKTVCQLGPGIEVLSGQATWRMATCTIKAQGAATRDSETELRQRGTLHVIRG